MIKRLILAIIIFCCLTLNQEAMALECIAANDFGLGGFTYIKANPNEDESEDFLLKSDPTTEPKGRQIAPWVETDLFTTGVASVGPDGERLNRAVLKIYVDGRWYPFGRTNPGELFSVSEENLERLANLFEQGAVSNDCSRDTDLPKCVIESCSPSNGFDPMANNSLCLDGEGERLNLGGINRNNVPCCVDHGFGLYGLISIERDGETANPNRTPLTSLAPPTSNFRTFHVWPLRRDQDGFYFELDLSKQCYLDSSNQKVCLEDTNANGSGFVQRGKLYFKINDAYYADNTGYYSLNVISGVFKKDGFIEKTVEAFESQTKLIAAGMFQLITRDTNFIAIVQALLVLYIALFGLMFAMGLIQANQADLVVRLVKLGLIATLISETSFEFFNYYLFELFSSLGKDISQIIYDSTLYYEAATESPRFILPENASPLSIYDAMIGMLISRSLHMKILGLVFSPYIWYVPFIYLAIGFVLIGIIRSVVVYVTSIVLVAMLLITGPIFLAMMLFKATQEFFDVWLKLLFAGAMMLMVVAASLAITISLFTNQIENLFSYSVCYQYLYTFLTNDIEILGFKPFSWFDFYFWYPNNLFEVSNRVTAENFFAFLFLGIIFNKIMQNIPQLIDTLANNNIQPFSSFSQSAESTFKNGIFMSAFQYGRALPIYVLKDNYLSQKIGGYAAKNTKVGRVVASGVGTAGAVAKGIGSVAELVDIPQHVDKFTRANAKTPPHLQPGWKETLVGSAQKTAGETTSSFKNAKDSKWYRVDK